MNNRRKSAADSSGSGSRSTHAPRRPSLGSQRSASPTPAAAESETLTVVCRFRPPSKRALSSSVAHYSFADGGRSVTLAAEYGDAKQYTFDRVYSNEDGQEVVAETVVGRIVSAVVDGYNGTVLACK